MKARSIFWKLVIMLEVVAVVGGGFYAWSYFRETPPPVIYTEDGRKCTVSQSSAKVCVDA